VSIIDRIRRFFQRQSEGTRGTQSERLDAIIKAQERDKRV
jgi:hypothetical protein